jgi:hypothetical protein
LAIGTVSDHSGIDRCVGDDTQNIVGTECYCYITGEWVLLIRC